MFCTNILHSIIGCYSCFSLSSHPYYHICTYNLILIWFIHFLYVRNIHSFFVVILFGCFSYSFFSISFDCNQGVYKNKNYDAFYDNKLVLLVIMSRHFRLNLSSDTINMSSQIEKQYLYIYLHFPG